MFKLKLPAEKRFDIAPAKEVTRTGTEIPVFMSDRLRKTSETQGWNEEALRKMGVVEFKANEIQDGSVSVNADLRLASETYFKIVSLRHELAARIESLAAAKNQEKRTGLKGLARLFENGIEDQATELKGLREEFAILDGWLKELKRAMSEVVKTAHGQKAKPNKQETEARSKSGLARLAAMRRFTRESEDSLLLPTNVENIERHAREMLYALARRGDAERKYLVFSREEKFQKELESKNEFFSEVVRLRQTMEDDLSRNGFGQHSEKSIRSLAASGYESEIQALADKALNLGLVTVPEGFDISKAKAAIMEQILVQLGEPSTVLRKRLEERNRQAADMKSRLVDTLAHARHADLLELVLEREVKGLMHDYHVRKKRFIPLGQIKTEMEELDRIVTGPNGPILRAFLYGPPGTGKTESLREIGARRGQNVRVISLHETSTFETLVGMHQIPLPKAETLADAERFWHSIENSSVEGLVKSIPTEVLEQFQGEDLGQKALDFKKWFEAKLMAARSVSAIGAVSPDDPRLRKAQQAALAAWLDQPLAQGLIDGDLIILDEADRAGNALEGLQDLLTRHPGQKFHPPGRPESFTIHPKSRVVMTANWGDVQTEMSGGQGRISAPIASRVLEKRKIDYLDPETETQLFEVMTSTPDAQSMLCEEEREMAKCLIEKIFPVMRDMYLRPGELQFITPMSVRTLENIKRRLIDETTRTRVLGVDGQPVHFVEAAWKELSSGPFREDQRERIIGVLGKFFAESGMFNHLDLGLEHPGLKHQVAFLTGLDAKTVEGYLGAEQDRSHGDVVVPKGYSFGKQLKGKTRAKNSSLNQTLILPSPRVENNELELEWKREMEDRGGNPEVQRQLQNLASEWIAERGNYPFNMEDPNQADDVLAADVRYLSNKLNGIDVTSGDVRLLLERLGEMDGLNADGVRERMGLLISLAINKVIGNMPKEQRSRFVIELDLAQSAGLDYVGYRMPAGRLILTGTAGNFLGRELDGGTIVAQEAGDKLGFDMRNGEIRIQTAGKRTCQRMRGGTVLVEKCGERLAMDAKGGTVTANETGDYAGQRSNAYITIGRAGSRLGEELGEKGKISVRTHDGFGKHIQGQLQVNGVEVYRNGQRVAA